MNNPNPALLDNGDRKVLTFNEKEIRAIVVDNDYWFVVKDLAEVIGLTNYSQHLKKLLDDQKAFAVFADTLGRNRPLWVVSLRGALSIARESKKIGSGYLANWLLTHPRPEDLGCGEKEGGDDDSVSDCDKVQLNEKQKMENPWPQRDENSDNYSEHDGESLANTFRKDDSEDLVHQTFISDDGIEIIINTKTGEGFCSQSGYARLSGLSKQAISERVKKVVSQESLKQTEIKTTTGSKTVNLITENIISDWIPRDNPRVATLMLKAGARIFLHRLAGFKVELSAVQEAKERSVPSEKQLKGDFEVIYCSMPLSHPIQDYLAELGYMKPILAAIIHRFSLINQRRISIKEDPVDTIITSSEAIAHFKQGTTHGTFPKINTTKRHQVMGLLGWEFTKKNDRYYYRHTNRQ